MACTGREPTLHEPLVAAACAPAIKRPVLKVSRRAGVVLFTKPNVDTYICVVIDACTWGCFLETYTHIHHGDLPSLSGNPSRCLCHSQSISGWPHVAFPYLALATNRLSRAKHVDSRPTFQDVRCFGDFIYSFPPTATG